MLSLGVSRPVSLPLWAFGFPFLLMALMLAGQTYFTAKRGYLYCGRSVTVAKKTNPGRYRIFLGLQITLVLVFFGLSTFGFWL